MKADFTRSTFDPKKHYHGVRQQQGRVQLDADWNEQVDLENYRVEAGTLDLMGGSGGLIGAAGFELKPGAIPTIGAGRFYVDGILAQNDEDVPVNEQPELPGFALPDQAGYYLAYLDVWQRNITALEDPAIREVALGGPDTTTRERTVWQVKLLGPYDQKPACVENIEDYDKLLNPQPARGRMKARTVDSSASNDLFSIPAGGGYRRLENQLYRVEIHQGGGPGTATFTWSRDNGSVVTSWLDQQGNDLVVGGTGRDQALGFAPGQTVELIDDARELRGENGVLVRISNAEGSSAGSVLTLDANDPNIDLTSANQFPLLDALGKPNRPRVRRWDSDGAIPVRTGWTPLEDGIEVSFQAGSYSTGDYWLIAARSAVSDIEWPEDDSSNPLALEAFGIQHHYCRLGVLQMDKDNNVFTLVEDCRPLFPAITDLVSFQYLGGDGQETTLGGVLPQPLRVGVTIGKWSLGKGPLALKKFKVLFEVIDDAGYVDNDEVDAATSTKTSLLVDVIDGVAACAWRPADNAAMTSQQLKTTLYYFDDLASPGHPTGHPSILFNTNLSLASQVTYIPGSIEDMHTVQDALDQLNALKVDRAGDTITGNLDVNGKLTVGNNPDDINEIMVDVNGILNAKEIYKDGVPLGFGVSRVIEQDGHGFKRGQPIYFKPASNKYELARSNAESTLGMFLVAEVKNEKQFTLLQAGYISGSGSLTEYETDSDGAISILSDLEAGSYYYVSGTVAGALVSDKPLSGISNPILYAISPSEGYVLPYQPSKAMKDYIDNLLVGSVTAFAMQKPPEGWLECRGQQIKRADYARLFDKIGTTFGPGDGKNYFNVPNLQGEFIRGWDNGALGSRDLDPHRVFGSHQPDQIQSHTHKDSGHQHTGGTTSDGSHKHNVSGTTAGTDPGMVNQIVDDNAYRHIFQPGFQTYEYWAGSAPHTHSINIDSTDNGTHSHKLNVQSGSASLGEPEESISGQGNPRHGNETRPSNVALLYCIKF